MSNVKFTKAASEFWADACTLMKGSPLYVQDLKVFNTALQAEAIKSDLRNANRENSILRQQLQAKKKADRADKRKRKTRERVQRGDLHVDRAPIGDD